MSNNHTPLVHAISYAARGWRVHPLKPGFKLPIFNDWPNIATTDRDTIIRWWTEDPSRNVGIVTGAVSGIFVLDVDDRPGKVGSASLLALEKQHGDLPHTYAVGTGSGGCHLYFRWPGFNPRNSASKLGADLDIRAEGGQVVAPPSRVFFDNRGNPDRHHFMPYQVGDARDPIDAGWLVDPLRPTERPARSSDEKFTRPAAVGKPVNFLATLKDVPPGKQDNKGIGAAATLLEDGYAPADVAAWLWEIAQEWPTSGAAWTPGDVERWVKSVQQNILPRRRGGAA